MVIELLSPIKGFRSSQRTWSIIYSKRFLPTNPIARPRVLRWLWWIYYSIIDSVSRPTVFTMKPCHGPWCLLKYRHNTMTDSAASVIWHNDRGNWNILFCKPKWHLNQHIHVMLQTKTVFYVSGGTTLVKSQMFYQIAVLQDPYMTSHTFWVEKPCNF